MPSLRMRWIVEWWCVLMINSCWRSWIRLQRKVNYFLSDSKICNVAFYFADFLNVLYPIQPSFILTLLCCRFDSTVNSLRTCKSLSSVSGQTGTLYWILWSAGPPRILPLSQHPTACPITESW